MPVTFYPAPDLKIEKTSTAENRTLLERLIPRANNAGAVATPETLLKAAREYGQHNVKKAKEILQSSFGCDSSVTLPNILPQRNGFVDTVVHAYNGHHSLVIRPDDVWLCILSQFSLFVNGDGRAEQLRHLFISHDGKKGLEIVFESGNRYTVDFGLFARLMTGQIDENIVDPTLREWILPNFSTTTPNDTVVASVLMMASLKTYFEYFCTIRCGFPQVTLLGERDDWLKLYHRLNKLTEYGIEMAAWGKLLRPILARFVKAFEPGYAESDENLDFWQRGIHYERGGSGPSYICGWITAFTVFGDQGQWLGDAKLLASMKRQVGCLEKDAAIDNVSQSPSYTSPDPEPCQVFSYTCGDIQIGQAAEHKLYKGVHLRIDNIPYMPIDTKKVAVAHAEVNVNLDDNGKKFDAVMIAGLAGMSVSDAHARDGTIVSGGQVSPVTAWWMYIPSVKT